MTVLQHLNFNKKKAAELLKIDRKTLYNKIKNYQA
jgi:two-component system response regulator HydG